MAMPTDTSYKDQLFRVLSNRYSNTGPIKPRSLNDVMNDIAAEKEAAAPAARPPRTLLGIGEEGGGLAGDIGLTALRGAVGIPQAAVGLANIPTGGRAGKFLEQHGFAPSVAQEELGKLYSPAQKFAQSEVDSAKGFLPTLQAYASNPSVAAQRVAESLPAAVAGGVAGRGLLALGKYTPTIARVAAPVAGRLGLSTEAAAGAAGESLVGAGQFAEQARAESPDRLITPAQQAFAPLAGGLSGLISAGGASIAPKIGLSDIDTVLAGGARQAAQTGGRAFNAAKGAAVEGIEEMAQSAQEQVLQNISTGKPWHEGIDKAAASGLLLGGATGAAMNSQGAALVAGVDERFAREREAIAEIGRQGLSNQELLQLRESPDALAEIGMRPESIDEVLSNRRAVAQQAEGVVASGTPESSFRGQAARLDLDKAARQEQNVPTGAGRAASAEQGQEMAPDGELAIASAFADMAATEVMPEFSLASEAADQAAGEVNEEARFEVESSASRKRAAGIPLSEQEQAALLAAEQRLADAAQAHAATEQAATEQAAAPPMQGTAQVARGIEGESREQVASGYDEYRPQPPGEPIEPSLRRGLPRQYAEVPTESVEPRTFARESEAYRKAANLPTSQSAEYKRIATLPTELPEELRNLDNMTRVKVRAVIEKMGIPVKKGASLADQKATVKQFAQSYQTRTPDQQAFVDEVDAREAAVRPAPKTPAQVEAERAAAEFEDLPVMPAPSRRPGITGSTQGTATSPIGSVATSPAVLPQAQIAGAERIAQQADGGGAQKVDVPPPSLSAIEPAKEKAESFVRDEDVAAALPVMMRELSQGTAGRRLRNAGESYGYDADAGAMIGEPSSYPKWIQEDPELSKAGRKTIERVAELTRTGGKMTERQIDLWSRLRAAARKEYSRNPEIQQGVEYDRLVADGYNFEAGAGGLLASDLEEGDSVALLEDGAIVRYTSQGVNENTGRVVFEKDGGGTKEFSGLDPVEPVAVKIKLNKDVPFSKAQAPLENAADVRAELAKGYSAGWLDRAERRGLFKFVDPTTAERLAVEMGIDPKRAAGGRIEGFISPDGQVHFVEGGIAKGQTLGVAAHELGTHAMRSGFTKEQDWRDVLAQSDRLLAKGDKAVVEARRRAVEAGTPDSLLREETVAYLSNIASKHGIIRSLIAKLKQFMINNNLASKFFISKLTAADLQALARGATKAAIKGKAAPEWAKGVDARLSYAGEKAKTADIKRLDEAKAMQAAGIDNEEIRQKTGWFQGLDKKWRFEIDDSEAMFFYPSAEKRSSLSKSEYGVDLVDILDHKSLYAAYPNLMDMQVYFRDGETAYYTGSNRKDELGYITIPIKFNSKYFNETLIHEIQHAIQSKSLENFSKGGAESSYNKQKEAKIYKGVIFIQDEIEKTYGRVPVTREEATEAVNKTISKYKENGEDWILPGKEVFDEYIRNRVFRLKDSLKPEYKEITDLIDVYGLNNSTKPRSGADIYRRLAGEIEAEDVSKRLSLSEKDRMTVRPYDLQIAGDGLAPINRDEIILTTDSDPSSISSRITPDLRVEATNKKGETVARPLTKKALAEQKPLTPVKEAVDRRVAELRSGLAEGDMLARKIEEEAQKKASPRRQAQVEKDLLEQVRVFKKQHLQPEIQDMANEIFGVIDPEARRMTPAKEANLKATRAEIERLKAEGADIDPALEAKVARLDRRRIGDMLPGEAQALLDVANELAYVNKTKNKLLAVERGQDAAELSKGIIAPIEAKPSKRYVEAKKTGQKAERGKNPILDLGRQLLGDPASTFKTLMLDLGRANEKSSAVKLAQTVAGRQNIELKHRKELDEQLARSVGKNWQALAESKAWNAEQDVAGRKLTSGEKVYLKYSLNDQNVSDSIEKMGYRKRLDTKAAKMSRAEREAIKLNPEEQKVYDALSDYFESTYQVLNPAHVEMKGWTLPAAGRGKYLPKSVSNLTLADELGSIIRSGSVENTGVVQDRLGTLNEINLKDIFEVIARQRDIASKYAAYAPMVRDFNLVFRSPELKNTLQMEYGVEKNGKSIVENYVDDLLRDLQGNKPQSDSGVEAAVRKVRTNAAGALLAFRLTTPLMQMTGYPRALAHISPQNLAKALRMRGGFEEAVKWNMRAYARRDAGIDREIFDNRNKRLIRAGMAGIQKVDELVTGRLWSATKLQTAQETGLRGDELLKETSRRFDAVLDTQGGHTMADLSMTSRTQSELAKMFTIFSSDKFAMLNEIKRGLIIREHTGDWKPLARASAGMVLSAAMAAGVATAVGGAVSGKDKDYEEEFAKNLAGSLPLFDQLVSMFQGFNPSSAGIEAIGDAANAAGRIASLARKQASGETVTAEQYSKALQVVVNSASLAAGVPVKNITDNLGFAKRLALGKDALEQVESELRSLEDFDFEKRKTKATKGKQGAGLRAALSKLRKEFADLDQEKVAAARRLTAAKKRIKEIDRELEGEVPAALRSRREKLREEIAARAVR